MLGYGKASNVGAIGTAFLTKNANIPKLTLALSTGRCAHHAKLCGASSKRLSRTLLRADLIGSGHTVGSGTSRNGTMTLQLQTLRTTAKRIARARRIPHHDALDFVARHLKQPHWNALTAAWTKGWRPESEDLGVLPTAEKTIDDSVMAIPVLGIGQGVQESGSIDGHAYTLEIDFEVHMAEIGWWSILVEQAPSKEPQIEIYNLSKTNPILDPVFRSKALAICHNAAERLRARISADWPRRSTKPDADGQAQHPLSKGVASKWYCLHCDAESSGALMAANMWHCPKCNATPIDIFMSPFWKAA